MTLNQLVGQQTLIGISGQTLTADEKKFIVTNAIGGVVLFGRNVVEPKQIHALCSEIQSLRKESPTKAPLFIGIDMEGGRVARLKAPFTQWPPLKELGDQDSATNAFNFAMYMGLELKAVGINLDFAPCVDVLTNPKNTVIGDRSISSDPEAVGKMASALVRGYVKSDIVTCAKHFPGHGNTFVDSHDDLPVEDLDLARLESLEFVPFKKVIKSKVDMIMSAHIRFPKIDADNPATLSPIFLKKILRDELRFRGVVITDDLDMGALSKHYSTSEIPVRALAAGVDMLLYCNKPESPVVAIEAVVKAIEDGQLKKTDVEASHARVLALKKERLASPDPVAFNEAIKVIGHPDHFKLAKEI